MLIGNKIQRDNQNYSYLFLHNAEQYILVEMKKNANPQ